MLNVNVFSSNLPFIKIVKKNFIIKNIYSDKLVDKNFRIFCNKNSIILKRIKKKRLKTINKLSVCLVFGFGFIFRNFIKKISTRDIKFSYRRSSKYRGRHPLTWAFLNDEKKIAMSI